LVLRSGMPWESAFDDMLTVSQRDGTPTVHPHACGENPRGPRRIRIRGWSPALDGRHLCGGTPSADFTDSRRFSSSSTSVSPRPPAERRKRPGLCEVPGTYSSPASPYTRTPRQRGSSAQPKNRSPSRRLPSAARTAGRAAGEHVTAPCRRPWCGWESGGSPYLWVLVRVVDAQSFNSGDTVEAVISGEEGE
jgi:hypothetical protein